MNCSHRNQALICCILALNALGCADRAKIHHKSVADLYQEAVEAVRNSEAATAVQIEMQNANAVGMAISGINDDSLTKKLQPVVPAHLTAGQLTAGQLTAAPLASLQPDLPVVSASWNFDQSQPANAVTVASEFLPGQPAPKSAVSKPLINEIFEQTEIREAIEILASTTGETVVVDDSIGGVVTLQIKDATFEQALEMLLLPLGLVYVVHDGNYLISPPDPESPLFRLISSRYQYSPTNHLPSKLAALVPKRLAPFFQVSDDRNLIAIEAPKAIGEDLLNRLQELDRPVQQVVLEAIVCVSAPDSGFKFGVDWNHTLQLNNLDQMKVGLSGLAFSGAASKYGVNNAFDEFAVTSAFVQLLAQQGLVTIRAAPRVTAKDGEKASISIERETFFSLQPTNTSVLFTQNIQKVQAGINLMLTPRIRGDRVSIEIEKAEVSEDIRTSETRKELVSNQFPIINRRTVSTKVDVLDGHTIVIGGLVQRQTVDRVNKVPFLGSLPGIGGLFRTIEKQEQDAEVAIFISPRIVRESAYLVPSKPLTMQGTVNDDSHPERYGASRPVTVEKQ